LTDALADAARAAGAVLATGHEAIRVDTDGRRAEVAYRTADGEGVAAARHVLVNASPQALAALTGDTPPHPAEGAQLKVNMLLERLPRLRDTSVDPREAFAGTFHIAEGYGQLAAAHAQAAAGKLPEAPPSEIYRHPLTDPGLLGPALAARGAHTLPRPRHPRPGPGRAGLPHAHPLRTAHPGPAVRAGQRRHTRAAPGRHPRPARRAPGGTARRLPGPRRGRAPLPGGPHPAGPGARPRAARRQHLPPRAVLAPRPGGHRPLGRGDPARQRPAVRRGRGARRRGQRRPGPQRGHGGAGGRGRVT